jgi:hypothetical protein
MNQCLFQEAVLCGRKEQCREGQKGQTSNVYPANTLGEALSQSCTGPQIR